MLRSALSTGVWTDKQAATRTRGLKVRPEPMAWQDAEVYARDWMRSHGYPDAKLTPPGADGGIDVIARKAVAQVKHHTKPVGLPEVQRLYGIAATSKRAALFFSAAGYTPKAREWGKKHGVRLLVYPPVRSL